MKSKNVNLNETKVKDLPFFHGVYSLKHLVDSCDFRYFQIERSSSGRCYLYVKRYNSEFPCANYSVYSYMLVKDVISDFLVRNL